MGQKSAGTEEQSRSTQPATAQKLPQKLQLTWDIRGHTKREEPEFESHRNAVYLHGEGAELPNGASWPDKND